MALTDAGVSAVCGLPALTSLDLSYCMNITDDALRTLSSAVPTLTHLNLHFCMKVTDAGMVAVSDLRALTSLDITLVQLTVRGLLALSSLPALRVLKQISLSDEEAQAVSKMAALTFLDVGSVGRGPTVEAMRAVSRLPALRSLILKDCNALTDAALIAVSSMPTLTFLDLYACTYITNEAVRAVSRMPAITALDLQSCWKLTDEAALAIRRMPALTALNLHLCSKMTMEGVRAVAEMPTLTDLVVSDRHNVLAEGAAHPVHPQTTAAELLALRTATAPGLRIDVRTTDLVRWNLGNEEPHAVFEPGFAPNFPPPNFPGHA
jgi:hypothetical protein